MGLPALTARQKEVLDFISAQVQRHGYAPSMREIGERLGISSTNGVSDHLKALERKGYISREADKSRALRVARLGAGAAQTAPTLVPLLWRVAAVEPIVAEEQALGHFHMDPALLGTSKRVFMLKVAGDSMIEAGILDGDYVFVKRQAHAERGEVVVAMLDGEATVKRFERTADAVRLLPANARLRPMVIAHDALARLQILGVVAGIYRRL